MFEDEGKCIGFWSGKLNIPEDAAAALFKDEYKLFEIMRTKLIKYRGVGYIEPDPENFPDLDEAVKMMKELDVLPSYAFLNGMSEGESDTGKLLKFFKLKDCKYVTVIPDRNWNVADEPLKKVILEKFHQFMQECRSQNLYVIAGTEMNKLGQKSMDDFTRPELAPYQEDFIKGADYVHDHSIQARENVS